MFIRTTALEKITRLSKRIRGVSGGTSAAKTVSILMWLTDYCQTHKGRVVSVVSETLPHLRRGAIRDFQNIMKDRDYWQDFRWLEPPQATYTFNTGSILEFFSADQPGKVRGPRRDILFINEANNISYETYTQLEVRTRRMVWCDWNPVAEFWFYTDVQPYSDVDFIRLTYRDNEALSSQEVEALERHRNNPNMIQWWKVFGEGLLGEAEGRIYTGWQEIDEIPFEARLEGYGLDFGYTSDPTAIVAVYKFNDGFILNESLYAKGMSNKMIADHLVNSPGALVLADGAEPKSIDEIQSYLNAYGMLIVAALKGQGSVSQGIQFVQAQKISVTKQSTNLIKEYRNYLWMKDKDGKQINEPLGVWNHCMDAVRYGLSKLFVKLEPEPVFNPPNVGEIRKSGAASDYGGVRWQGLKLAR